LLIILAVESKTFSATATLTKRNEHFYLPKMLPVRHHMSSMLRVEVRMIPIPLAEACERSRQLQELLLTGALRHVRAPIEEKSQTKSLMPMSSLDQGDRVSGKKF
jgi:hypothetical protein